MRKTISLTAAGLAIWMSCAAPSFAASPVEAPSGAQYKLESGEPLTLLSGEALRKAFAGKTHYGTYKQFREETGTNQFTETTAANGRTLYKEGDQVLNGKWVIYEEDVLCFNYDEMPGFHCFRMYEAGTCIYGYSPDNTGVLGPINANGWEVKSVRKGDISTCDDLTG